jgi:carbonic anhydrase
VGERYAHLEGAARMLAAVEENVLVQLENLRAFPNVAERLERGVLSMSGWVFEIGSGEVYEFDPRSGQFGPIAPSVPPPKPLTAQP